jgi:hypothetical protein
MAAHSKNFTRLLNSINHCKMEKEKSGRGGPATRLVRHRAVSASSPVMGASDQASTYSHIHTLTLGSRLIFVPRPKVGPESTTAVMT